MNDKRAELDGKMSEVNGCVSVCVDKSSEVACEFSDKDMSRLTVTSSGDGIAAVEIGPVSCADKNDRSVVCENMKH